MPRIPDEEIERIKHEVDLGDLIRESGVALKRVGLELMGLCPFHPDKTPSLSVRPSKGAWRCFGCLIGGSAFDWVMKRDGVGFPQAYETLSRYLGGNGHRRSAGPAPEPLPEDASGQERLRWALDYYHATLMADPVGLGYLRRRLVGNEQLLHAFKIGYANRTLGDHLPAKSPYRDDDARGWLTKLGILRDSGHETFRGSIVFPVLDENSDVAEIYGRKVRDDLRKGTPKHMYLSGSCRLTRTRGIWNWQGLVGQQEVLITEGIIDALTLIHLGFPNATSSYGADVFSDDHVQAFRRFGVKRVLIAFDRDEAGDQGAIKAAAKLGAVGIGCYRVLFPHGMDVNEYALKMTPPEKAMLIAVQSAVWMGQGPAPSREVVVLRPPKAELEASVVLDPVAPTEIESVGQEDLEGAAAEEEAPVSVAEVEEGDEPDRRAMPKVVPFRASDKELPLSAAVRPGPSVVVASEPGGELDPLTGVRTRIQGEEVWFYVGDRAHRVRGLAKNTSYDVMKVNLRSSRGDEYHVDSLDFYSSRQRVAYIRAASTELKVQEDVVKKDLGKILSKLEQMQDEQIKKTLEPKEKVVVLSDEERAAAMELLRSPDLVERIVEDLGRCGLVGERINKLTCYAAAVSRKLAKPLAIIVQSSTAAGKSAMMDAILAVMPEEECVRFSAVTGQALFYLGKRNLKHKILAISEEQGAARASYSLKLLQSEGKLSIASTGKDPQTGEMETKEYDLHGPVMLILTTTAIDIDEELMNRCIVLSVREDREQTRAIHELQRELETIEGILAHEDKAQICKLHQDAQRLLQPLRVSNPYAKQLTFIDTKTRTRRDNPKYLTLIRAIALLHQYQRPRVKRLHRGQEVEYIEATLEDIQLANEIANEVLGRSLQVMPEQTRDLLVLLDRMVAEACATQGIERQEHRFNRREVREYCEWSDGQLQRHMARLEQLEYLLVHRGGRGQSIVYELLYNGEGKQGERFLLGLTPVEKLRKPEYDGQISGAEGQFFGGNGPIFGSSSGHLRAKTGHLRVEPIGLSPSNGKGSSGSKGQSAENAYKEKSVSTTTTTTTTTRSTELDGAVEHNGAEPEGS